MCCITGLTRVSILNDELDGTFDRMNRIKKALEYLTSASLSVKAFIVIFLLSLAADFIANDKPLLVYYRQQVYLPIFKTYPETTFDGIFETETNYRDPVVQQLINRRGFMIQAPIPFSYDTPNLTLTVPVPSPPSRQNWLGTDDQGRDVLARILYGLRISLLFGLCLTVTSALLGIIVGALQGYYGGWVDLIGQRVLEVWGGLPQLFILMIVVGMFSPNVYWLFLMMLLFSWTSLVGLVRAEIVRVRNFEYVQSARALGISEGRIIFRHILPNALSSTWSQLPFILAGNITALTALDFLGYGLPPNVPSLGELLQQGRHHLDAPWLVLSGFFTLTLVLTLLIHMGEVVRERFKIRS